MEAKTSEWRPGPTVCRCCLTEGCYKDISTEYFWMGKREVYAEMLADTLNLTIAYSQSGGPNSNSRLICEPCISRLRDAADFKRQVQECEKTFLQHLDPSTSGIVAEDVSRESILKGKQVKIELVKLEKDSDDDDFEPSRFTDDDDVDDDIDDQPLTKLAKTPKKETVDLLDLIDNAKVAEKRKSTTKVKATPVKKAKQKKDTKATANQDKPEKKKKDKCDPVRRNAEIIIRYTTASPFRVNVKSVTCVYCGDLYQDPEQFRVHMANEHKPFSLHMAFAKLPKSEYVKVDITNMKCRLCQIEYKTLEIMGLHLIETHSKDIALESPLGVMPFTLDKDNWNCAVCNKNLPSLLHLNKHTLTHFQSFVCDVCGKSYIASTGLLTHVRSKHENEYKAYCKRCQVIFPSMKAKQIHQRTDKSCMTHCCLECPERFPSYEYKQRHMAEAHGFVRNEYNCLRCPLTFTHRQAFYDHFKKAHSVDCAICNHCGVKFSSPSKLNRHMKKHVT
ncbi:PREDICTED: zinc finger protein 699 isoform X14 [Papilio xuthus]|uniref:Zinc finger protein 699 isoform X14 n=1 Tax=Papilio xuthus TaxID=66420 RepID=A0AAJ6Z252_PAPXU|nr:PREDICTED: zinc finger protein 699 isoform X14 [Papilio xuthus]